jgi:peptide/nickel transport system permease protein
MTTTSLEEPSKSGAARVRGQKGSIIATIVLLGIIVIVVLAPLLPIANPLAQDLTNRNGAPSLGHWLGQDTLGRDILSRVIWGARTSLLGVVAAIAIAALVGIPWGLIAAYFGGWADEIIMRLADGVLAIPGIVLAIGIVGVLGPSLINTMVAIGVVFSPTIARLMRSEALPILRADYVSASVLAGTSRWLALWRHVFPNAIAPVFVQLCSLTSLALIVEAGLSFLGMGTQPPAPSLGGDLAGAYLQFNQAPWGTLVPGFAVSILAFLLSRVGDELRVRMGIK